MKGKSRSVCLVLLETGGNQRYIFSSNKLRENIGASELTHKAGTAYVLDALHQATANRGGKAQGGSIAGGMSAWLGAQPRIESGAADVEILQAAAGKALLLVASWELGVRIVRNATEIALRQAPGLDLKGVVSEPFDFGPGSAGLGGKVGQVHEALARLRGRLPGPEARFPRLPILAECATSGWPAESLERVPGPDDRREPRSAVAQAKWRATDHAFTRMQQAAGDFRLARTIEELERCFEATEWLAVVHADGNGLGAIFSRFQKLVAAAHPGAPDDRQYANDLCSFSLELEQATEAALRSALGKLKEWLDRDDRDDRERNPILPVVPLILGGDDLTLVMDGRFAVPFTREYLVAFEARTGDQPTIGTYAKHAGLGGRLTACAGVAIIKPHFPFHLAYELAGALIHSAKLVKQQQGGPWSALDWHILYDVSASGLEEIRRKLVLDEARLYAKPYVASEPGPPAGHAWAARGWGVLEKRVAALRRQRDGRRVLPRSFLHELREALFLGREEAEARGALLQSRQQAGALSEALATGADGRPKFFEPVAGVEATGFLDALELIDFWPGDSVREGAHP